MSEQNHPDIIPICASTLEDAASRAAVQSEQVDRLIQNNRANLVRRLGTITLITATTAVEYKLIDPVAGTGSWVKYAVGAGIFLTGFKAIQYWSRNLMLRNHKTESQQYSDQLAGFHQAIVDRAAEMNISLPATEQQGPVQAI